MNSEKLAELTDETTLMELRVPPDIPATTVDIAISHLNESTNRHETTQLQICYKKHIFRQIICRCLESLR